MVLWSGLSRRGRSELGRRRSGLWRGCGCSGRLRSGSGGICRWGRRAGTGSGGRWRRTSGRGHAEAGHGFAAVERLGFRVQTPGSGIPGLDYGLHEVLLLFGSNKRDVIGRQIVF